MYISFIQYGRLLKLGGAAFLVDGLGSGLQKLWKPMVFEHPSKTHQPANLENDGKPMVFCWVVLGGAASLADGSERTMRAKGR